MSYVVALLLILLVIVLWRYHLLSVSHALMRERVLSQDELQGVFTQVSQESYRQIHNEIQADDAEREEDRRQMLLQTIRRLEQQLQQLELERKSDHGSLKQQLHSMMDAEHALKLETSKLAKALRSPAGRGRWGELQLRRVVELAGMVEHCDFVEQGSTLADGVRKKPDLIIKLAGDRNVVVDAKVPLEAYLEGVEHGDDAIREEKFMHHSRQLKDHIITLGKKSYWQHFQPTPEFVVLFLPSETIFSAALERDPTLMEVAADHRVVLATPMTLIALLRAVAYGWQQDSISRHADRIRELGQELYKRIGDLTDHWSGLGKALDHAMASFNRATGCLERSVLSSARKLGHLGAGNSSHEIKEMLPLDTTSRSLVAPEFSSSGAETNN